MDFSVAWIVSTVIVIIGTYFLGLVWRNGADRERPVHLRDRVLQSVTPLTSWAKALLLIGYASAGIAIGALAFYGSVYDLARGLLFDFPLATELEITQPARMSTGPVSQYLELEVVQAAYDEKQVHIVATPGEVAELIEHSKTGPISLFRHPKKPKRFMTAQAGQRVKELSLKYPWMIEVGAIAAILVAIVLAEGAVLALTGFLMYVVHLRQTFKRQQLDKIFWNLHWEKYPKVRIVRPSHFVRYASFQPYLCYAYPLPEGKRTKLVYRGLKQGEELEGVLVQVQWNREVFFSNAMIEEIEAYKSQNSRRRAS